MEFLKRILDNYFDEYFGEKNIHVLCWDSESNGETSFYLELQSYPPIGAHINMSENEKFFKIESLEIQNYKGLFCIAKGRFID